VPYILVALILPLHEFCTVASQLLLAPRVARFVLRKRSVGAWLGTAVAYGVVREMPSEPAPQRSLVTDLKRGFELVGRHRCFGRFLVWRGLALSVELAIPFYAIHAASLHDTTGQNLSMFVVVISLD
jgi:hypothetical protein